MATAEVKTEQQVYVCLRPTYCDGKHILSWALGYFSKKETKIFATVFSTSIDCPSIKKTLDQHLDQCARQKFKAERLVHKNDDQVKGIVELIDSRAIKNLVMEFIPKSEKIASVIEKAKPSCKIWFISEGNLILTRNPKSDCTEATSGEIIRREKLHQKEIEEIQKRENNKHDLLKKENELLKLENQLLRNQRNDSLEWLKKFYDLDIDYQKLKHDNAMKEAQELRKKKEHSGKTGGKSRFVS